MASIKVIGAAIIDVAAYPVDFDALPIGSLPMEGIQLSFGGDALNQTVVLSHLGMDVNIVTTLGHDEAGKQVKDFLSQEGVGTEWISQRGSLSTSINIVLVDKHGERFFLTDPRGSMRMLSLEEIRPSLGEASSIVSFASMFISPKMDIAAMESLFREIKATPGVRLAADMTKPKNGESLEAIAPLLRYVDYLFPNAEEAALLTGQRDPEVNAALLTEAGVGCAVVKCGRDGCVLSTGRELVEVPAYPVEHVVDTTGAGDSFAAGFLYGVTEGMEPYECCLFGNAVASCTVEVFGANQGVPSDKIPWRRYGEMLDGGRWRAKR